MRVTRALSIICTTCSCVLILLSVITLLSELSPDNESSPTGIVSKSQNNKEPSPRQKLEATLDPITHSNWTMLDIRRGKRGPEPPLPQEMEKPLHPSQWEGLVDIVPTAINRTPRDSKVLVYNRVPKCASSTMQNLLAKLAKRNNFSYVSSKNYWRYSSYYFSKN